MAKEKFVRGDKPHVNVGTIGHRHLCAISW